MEGASEVHPQILWGNYELRDENGQLVGGLKVDSGGLFEQWFLLPGTGRYSTPKPGGGTVKIKFHNLGITAPDMTGTEICVASSVRVDL